MRSKASIDGHPIHPALIPFPFAFLCGAFGFDVLGRLLDRPALSTTGYQLAVLGLLSAVVAAIPGIVDYVSTVPPRSAGRRRATWHMVLALTTTALFVVAVLLRGSATRAPTLLVLAIEAVAIAVLGAAGWLGGILVVRDQISVDHRFAGGRRLREVTARHDGSASGVVAAGGDELGVDQMKLVRLGDKRFVLARTATGYVAFDDACPHEGGSLAGGTMIDGVVQCPWHGSQFDSRTGCVRAGPADCRVGVYPVEESDDLVRIKLP